MADTLDYRDSTAITTLGLPDPVVAPVQEEAPAREKGSGRKKARKAPSRKGAPVLDYEKLGIAAEDVPLYEEVRQEFVALGRKKTDEVFVCGAALSRVRERCPDQQTFEKWSKAGCGLTRRGADNYINVYRNLGAFRDTFVEHSVPAAAMYALSTVPLEKVAAVAALFDAGERPTVRDIKTMIADGTETPARESSHVGGASGLKALMREKTRVGVPVVMERLGAILDDIQEGLKRHLAGKRVAKADLIAKVEHSARRARTELQSLSVFVEPNPHGPQWLVHPVVLPNASGWGKVGSILYKLGGREDWPDADKLGQWLVDEVVPALEWAVGPRPMKKAKEPEAEAGDSKATAKVKKKAKAVKLKPARKAGPDAESAGASAVTAQPQVERATPKGRAEPSAKKGKTKVEDWGAFLVELPAEF